MLLFRDEEHAERWRASRGLGLAGTMSLGTGWQLAQAWYEDRLSEDWRRKTLAEAEETFARLGLTGDFWRLRPNGA